MILTTPIVLIILLFSTAYATELTIDQQVSFELPRAPLTQMQEKRLPEGSQNLPGRTIVAHFRVPEKTSPLPAAVLIHTCHDAHYYLPWIERLNKWGFATLSFSRCQPPDYLPDEHRIISLDWKNGAPAAYAALGFLRDNSSIAKNKIVLIAWSRLGMIPLSIFNFEGYHQFYSNHYTAAVALYPFCSFARGPHLGPILVLSAEHDDWVDTKVCLRMARDTQHDEHPVAITIVPDTWHGFDIEAFGPPRKATIAEINPDGYAAGEGTLGFSKQARDQAIHEIHEFLRSVIDQ